MSAFVGFVVDLALTSATSSGASLSAKRLKSNGLKWIAAAIAWSVSEMASAVAKSRPLRGDASASGGMRAGGSAPATAMRAVLRGIFADGVGAL
jgi:hypothetical protein